MKQTNPNNKKNRGIRRILHQIQKNNLTLENIDNIIHKSKNEIPPGSANKYWVHKIPRKDIL